MSTDRLVSAWESMRNKELELLKPIPFGWGGRDKEREEAFKRMAELDARVERLFSLLCSRDGTVEETGK